MTEASSTPLPSAGSPTLAVGRRRSAVFLIAAWLLFAIVTLWGAAAVPFHPDESTHLYMSRDFDLLFLEGDWRAVTWDATEQPPLVIRYRRLDAPLSRYLVGLGRALGGYAGRPLTADWDWSATWEANVAAGALSEAGPLLAGRVPAAVLTAISPLLVFAVGRRLGGYPVGAAAAVLYAVNGMILLHGRRAMSEGPLLFALLLGFWLCLRAPHRPALLGLAAALAAAAKLSGLTLLPIALLAAVTPLAPEGAPAPRISARLRALAALLLAFLAGSLALNPSLWSAPLAGLQAMLAARQQFLAEQAAFLASIAPHLRLASPGLRALALVYHTYSAPLAYADVGNYTQHTRAAEAAYAANPLNFSWNAGPAAFAFGGLLLALTLVGSVLAIRRLLRRNPARPAEEPSVLLLMVAWTLATVLGLLTIAVPAQRHYLPFVPLACLWVAYGLVALIRPPRVPVR